MDSVNDLGLLKSKVFGGFDKKSVFGYVEELSKKHNAEKQELESRISSLEQQLESVNEQLKVKNDELSEKDNELEQMKNRLEEHISHELKSAEIAAVSQLDEQNRAYAELQSKYEQKTAENDGLKAENERLKAENDKITSDFQSLSDIYRQLDRSVSQIEQNSEQINSENGRLKQDVSDLSAKLSNVQTREEMLKQSQQQTDEKLSNVSSQLNEYMQNCTKLQGMLDRQNACLTRLKSTVSQISNIDFSAVEEIEKQVGSVIEIINQIKSAVGIAMCDCTPSDDSNTETQAVISEISVDSMNEQRRKANEILSHYGQNQ